MAQNQYLKKTLMALEAPPFMCKIRENNHFFEPFPKFSPSSRICIYVEWNEFVRIWIGDLHDFFAILHVLHFPDKME